MIRAHALRTGITSATGSSVYLHAQVLAIPTGLSMKPIICIKISDKYLIADRKSVGKLEKRL
jgi:hypothetical protein